jgi:hypothetical protein
MQALQQYSDASATTIFRYTTEGGKQRQSRADGKLGIEQGVMADLSERIASWMILA